MGRPSHLLQHDRAALAAPDAHGGEAERRASAAHFFQERRYEAVGGGADGMAERDRASVDVGLLPVDLPDRPAGRVLRVPGGGGEDFRVGEHLRREGLVDLD